MPQRLCIAGTIKLQKAFASLTTSRFPQGASGSYPAPGYRTARSVKAASLRSRRLRRWPSANLDLASPLRCCQRQVGSKGTAASPVSPKGRRAIGITTATRLSGGSPLLAERRDISVPSDPNMPSASPGYPAQPCVSHRMQAPDRAWSALPCRRSGISDPRRF